MAAKRKYPVGIQSFEKIRIKQQAGNEGWNSIQQF